MANTQVCLAVRMPVAGGTLVGLANWGDCLHGQGPATKVLAEYPWAAL